MSNVDWYRNKIAALRGSPPAAPQQRYQQPVYQPYQQPQYQQPPQVQQRQPPPPVTMENLYAAAGYWTGGKAHRIDRDPCPECGSNQFYSRTDGTRRGPPPAPHCYNCGYNGMFQQGDPTTWGVA